jgi:hypothetical protein
MRPRTRRRKARPQCDTLCAQRLNRALQRRMRCVVAAARRLAAADRHGEGRGTLLDPARLEARDDRLHRHGLRGSTNGSVHPS